MGRKSSISAPPVAATAEKLATAVNIGGVSFNGGSNINLPGVNISGTQDTTGNANTATTATMIPVLASSPNSVTSGTAGELIFVFNSLSHDGLWMNFDGMTTWKRISFDA